ncbi:hypothetical protein Prum_079970 [Phytohabitans rumicis]|uniref:Enoyl reductase (ER) domain-containing protein n=1 Tax=Phytohabitans rumicis TaxID=1076125 RepID=A0A6V8LNS8_9ACTN|nr:hypothetical protein Prum_079970 [Phytohabitans rumicis]
MLTLVETPTPEPGPGQVLVRLSATGVNFVDTYHRTGLYPSVPPFTPGSEGAGTVVAVGPDVTGPAVGDRVASTNLAGAYAQFAVAPANRVVPVPAEVSDEQAAAALLQGMTAHYLLHDSYPVRPGDTVLVHAAAGGMGLLLTQLATKLGARVIGTVSSPEKEKLARQAGRPRSSGTTTSPPTCGRSPRTRAWPRSTTASGTPPSTPASPACGSAARWPFTGTPAVRCRRST